MRPQFSESGSHKCDVFEVRPESVLTRNSKVDDSVEISVEMRGCSG